MKKVSFLYCVFIPTCRTIVRPCRTIKTGHQPAPLQTLESIPSSTFSFHIGGDGHWEAAAAGTVRRSGDRATACARAR